VFLNSPCRSIAALLTVLHAFSFLALRARWPPSAVQITERASQNRPSVTYRYGRFALDQEGDAARAFDNAARKHHGKSAGLNFPAEGEQGTPPASRYRGVCWVKPAIRDIQESGKLGSDMLPGAGKQPALIWASSPLALGDEEGAAI
jgi:hypothetical protein